MYLCLSVCVAVSVCIVCICGFVCLFESGVWGCMHVFACVCEDVTDGRDLNIYSQAKEKESVGREKSQGKPIDPQDFIGDGRILES